MALRRKLAVKFPTGHMVPIFCSSRPWWNCATLSVQAYARGRDGVPPLMLAHGDAHLTDDDLLLKSVPRSDLFFAAIYPAWTENAVTRLVLASMSTPADLGATPCEDDTVAGALINPRGL